AAAADDLMYLGLANGERRLPDALDVEVAAAVEQSAAAADAPAQQENESPQQQAAEPATQTVNAGQTVTGTSGADSFTMEALTIAVSRSGPAAFATHIADYSALQGDTIDVSAIVTLQPVTRGQPAPTDADMVRVAEDASGAFAALEVKSAGNWTEVAQL